MAVTDPAAAPAAPASLGWSEPDDTKRAANVKAEHDTSSAAMVTEFKRVQAATTRIADYQTAQAAVDVDALAMAKDQATKSPRVI